MAGMEQHLQLQTGSEPLAEDPSHPPSPLFTLCKGASQQCLPLRCLVGFPEVTFVRCLELAWH